MNDLNGSCIWCGNPDLKAAGSAIASYRERTYSFVLCSRCGIKRAVPPDAACVDYEQIQARKWASAYHRADNEWIASILANGPERLWTTAAHTFLKEKTLDSRYGYALDYVRNAYLEGRSLRILEVGCNQGYATAVMARYGHRCTGIDVQKAATTDASQRYGPIYECCTVEDFQRSSTERFDLICALEVIEHLADPKSFLLRCRDLLKPGGILILTTPDGDPMAAGCWLHDLPPIHLTIFSRQTFLWLRTEGWQVDFPEDGVTTKSLRHFERRFRRRRNLHEQLGRVPEVDPASRDFVYRAEAYGDFQEAMNLGSSLTVRALKSAARFVGIARRTQTIVVRLAVA